MSYNKDIERRIDEEIPLFIDGYSEAIRDAKKRLRICKKLRKDKWGFRDKAIRSLQRRVEVLEAKIDALEAERSALEFSLLD